MIVSFRHKGLRQFFETGNRAGIQPHHSVRLNALLTALDTAKAAEDMDVPGFHLHLLSGDMRNRWSVKINANWRLTFELNRGNAYLLDYEDYH